MSALLVLMSDPCPTCGSNDARLRDDDACYENFLEEGGIERLYDPVENCEHLDCANCGESLS